ncbi:proteasome maturation protein-like protein [Dinothrombium tinctorium]|uniref:Proteasome maturation protein-like protein n=1 Tax=Dinothrombium tinctorium TaxID=1965070 RepID=A0A443RFR8_9ACAR|nr:proteasome maturation protein-like protein [Dinothrombium tinctorium]RWS14123.1 proteasome maturation protein-like protein [Dinothrombium tinctorium]
MSIAFKSQIKCEKNKVNPERSTLLDGFAKPANLISVRHPLEMNEQHFKESSDAMDFALLRQVQGIHAPLRLMMERKAASEVGRLPFLPSSNLMLDVLESREDSLNAEDFLNDVSTPETVGIPHMVMERKLGLL